MSNLSWVQYKRLLFWFFMVIQQKYPCSASIASYKSPKLSQKWGNVKMSFIWVNLSGCICPYLIHLIVILRDSNTWMYQCWEELFLYIWINFKLAVSVCTVSIYYLFENKKMKKKWSHFQNSKFNFWINFVDFDFKTYLNKYWTTLWPENTSKRDKQSSLNLNEVVFSFKTRIITPLLVFSWLFWLYLIIKEVTKFLTTWSQLTCFC